MTPAAHPWAVSAAVQEHLTALARRYDDAAERLTALAARCAEPALARTDWTGPGSRACRARLERHGADIREEVERCRETAQSLRWGGAALAERIAAVESAVDLGGPLTAVLGAVLGPGLLGCGPQGSGLPSSAAVDRAPAAPGTTAPGTGARAAGPGGAGLGGTGGGTPAAHLPADAAAPRAFPARGAW